MLMLVARSTALALVLLVLLAQAVPYGRAHTNPPVRAEPAWSGAQTRALADRACFDCHSNDTRWPWYSHVAPLSWTIQRHVDDGRAELNFSEWDRRQDADDIAEEVLEGSMPPRSYLLLHPEARLSAVEVRALLDGLGATVGGRSGAERDRRTGRRD